MMSHHSRLIPPIPKETARAANATFSRSNFYIVIGEHLETLLEDIWLSGSSEKEEAAKIEEATSALITFFQFVEGLTDIQAVDAIRTRVDWKFALHLSPIPARLYENVLCEFRQRLLTDSTSQCAFQKSVDQLTTLIPSLSNNFQNLKSPDVAAFVCSVNRVNHAQQTMNQVLEILAARFPDWLRKIALPHWYVRYSRMLPRLEVAILLGQQQFLMEEIGADIHHLLEKIHQSGAQEIEKLDEVKVLHQVWSQQFKTLDGSPDHESENLSLKDCHTCAYRGTGRRLPA